ncbi:MAG: transposase [Synechococcaceae cyanobacterium RL_1_2]|nr:transposase [Synechococcaceae cyanobacterium RL_1_2]
MLEGIVFAKQLDFRTVLMDSWYAPQKPMAHIDQLGKIYYCPLKPNRKVDDSGGSQPYQRVDAVDWDEATLAHGKQIKIRGFPRDKKGRRFWVKVSSHRTDFVATNNLTQDSTDVVQDESGIRWKIEAFLRELKQLTCVEACPCRRGPMQRNHIACFPAR